MTARELIKELESCDLDKNVAVIVAIIGEAETGHDVVLREVKLVVENETLIGIQ